MREIRMSKLVNAGNAPRGCKCSCHETADDGTSEATHDQAPGGCGCSCGGNTDHALVSKLDSKDE